MSPRSVAQQQTGGGGANGGGSQWVPPEPMIESPLDNNPDFFANLQIPTAQFADSGAVTWGLDDPNAPRAPSLAWEWVAGEPQYPDIEPSVAGSNYDRHPLDTALLGGLNWINDKTQIPPLVEAKDYLDRQLEAWADRSLQGGPSALDPLYGGLYGAGKAGLGMFPTGAVDVVPELGALGKLGRVGRAAEDLRALNDLNLTDELASGAARRVSATPEDFAAAFEPLGLTTNPASFAEGRRMLYELERSGLTAEAALSRAQEFIGSSATLPIATPIDRTDTLIKLVPQDGAVPHGSPYWITESEYQKLVEQPGAIADRLGLPLQSRADAYDVYAIRPADSGAVVYQSVTAPTRQGSFVQPGGSVQTFIIDRNLFTPPTIIGTVPGR